MGTSRDRARDADRARLRRLATTDLTDAETRAIRDLLHAAFAADGDVFDEGDWRHAIGGEHFVLDLAGEIVAHASVVERRLEIGGRPLRTGYVEAVATAPDHQGKGLGSRVMREVGAYIRERFELGALGTGRQRFYERLGWSTWAGRSFVRAARGLEPTSEDDGYILVLTTSSTPPFDPEASISCEWRAGDVW